MITKAAIRTPHATPATDVTTIEPEPQKLGHGQLPECPVLVAQKTMLQLAEGDIRHLTDVEPQPHRPCEAVNGTPRQVLSVDRDHPAGTRCRRGALLGPGADCLIQASASSCCKVRRNVDSRHHAGDPRSSSLVVW